MTASGDPVIAAAGDIACAPGTAKTNKKCHQLETSNLIAGGGYDAVLPVGDEQYNCGQANAFLTEYGPTWGRFNSLAHPVVGDNEYAGSGCSTPGAAGYFTYFGNRASPDQPGCVTACKGYYSYDVGAWHVVALNSECTQPGVGGCGATNPMGTWLKQDLAAHPTACTLAYLHRPYWANGAVTGKYKPLVQELYDGGVEILLAGHNHIYSRFAPQNPNSVADPNGIRQFTVGTGGVNHTPLSANALPNTEKRDNTTFGILALTLHPSSYDFSFVPDTTSGGFTDSGSGQCQGGSTPPTQAPTVNTGTATAVGQDIATLNGTVNPNGAATDYSFEYGTTTAYGNSTAPTSAGAGTSLVAASASISGLAANTTYHYRLVANNASGTSLGADQSFTTTGSTPGSPTVALWHMDEGPAATVMSDSSGFNHDGVISADVQTGVPGMFGNAYEFTGPVPIVRVPDDAQLDPGASALTVSTWLKVPTNLVTGDYNVVQKGKSTAVGGAYKLEIYAPQSTAAKFGFPACAFNGANGATNRVYGPASIGSIADGQWHHVVCHLTAGGNATAYAEVDGTPGPSIPRTVNSISNTSELTLGGKPNNTHFFQGVVDEVSLDIG